MKKKEINWRKLLLAVLGGLLSLFVLGMAAVLIINSAVCNSVKDSILPADEAAELQDFDGILVLGCGVRDDGSPSAMLYDRLQRSVEMYEAGVSDRLLMTGDHGRENYDEVAVMKSFAVDAGVPSEDVFMDHAGFSTYESMYRAKEIFQAKKVIIITQEYHLYRAIYIAESLGLEAYGVAADYRAYYGQTKRDIREVLARVKDFGTSMIKPKPTYLGKAIPIWGDGNLTNDENSDFS
jgi:vancomycin permeability regulator SanA